MFEGTQLELILLAATEKEHNEKEPPPHFPKFPDVSAVSQGTSNLLG